MPQPSSVLASKSAFDCFSFSDIQLSCIRPCIMNGVAIFDVTSEFMNLCTIYYIEQL